MPVQINMRVRPLKLSDPDALELAGKSLHYGSFSEVPTSLCWHRAGFLIGVNRARHKMEILDFNAGLLKERFDRPASTSSTSTPTEGRHLNSTTGFTPTRMIVDHWRNVVTLNWMPMLGVNGRTEPTISSWSAYEAR